MNEKTAAVEAFASAALKAVFEAVGSGPVRAADSPLRTGPVDVVIPVYENAGLVQRCVNSVLPTLIEGDLLWLLDDASTEPGVSTLLSSINERHPSIRVLRNDRNLGFVANTNQALQPGGPAASERDVVLLNSDTQVTEGWLNWMQACQSRQPRAGIICPISNRATILSALPDVTVEEFESAMPGSLEWTTGDIPLPTAVGFCMLLSREMLNEIGYFSDLFAPGYGEENDLSMRAMRAGWNIYAADQAVVFHHSGASFGRQQARALQTKHQQTLDQLWPEYAPLVQSWWRENPLRARTEQLAKADGHKRSVLHVLHRQYHVGGTERVARSLIDGLGERYWHTLAYPGETNGAWCDMEVRGDASLRELMINHRWIRPALRIAGHGADLSCGPSERAMARIIQGQGSDIVHFHHFLHWDSLLLPLIAKACGSRVVISIHDFWFNCPIHNQLKYSTGRPCGIDFAGADQRCDECLSSYCEDLNGKPRGVSEVKAYAVARHDLVSKVLNDADAILVPSQFIKNKITGGFRSLRTNHIHVFEQGVSEPVNHEQSHDSGQSDGQMVIGYFGGDQFMKGSEIMLEMARAFSDRPVQFRVFGRVRGFKQTTLPRNVQLAGFYNPVDVSSAMRGIDLALLPSHYEESYSMVASECWIHGVPVMATNKGALSERVVDGLNGWLVNSLDPKDWIRTFDQVLTGDQLRRCRSALSKHSVTTLAQSADKLHSIYHSLPTRPERDVPPKAPALTRFHQKLDALRHTRRVSGTLSGAKKPPPACLGIVRDNWGTAHYRLRFPLQQLAAETAVLPSDKRTQEDGQRAAGAPGQTVIHVVREQGFKLDAVLAQPGLRHVAMQPFVSDEGLRMAEQLHRQAGLSVSLVIDDLWTDIPADNPVHRSLPSDLRQRLQYLASLSQSLVLTTNELERRLDVRHPRKWVIENALPEALFQAHSGSRVKREGKFRAGWSGAPQHAADLKFLKQVIEKTSDLADWVLLGMCPEQLLPMVKEFHPMVPFDDYPSSLAALDLDLAVAPLMDHPFNRCKSHLKVLEYGVLGYPVIASDLPPYQQCPVMLAGPEDVGDWVEKIRFLLNHEDQRVAQSQQLRDWVLKHNMIRHRSSQWLRALGMSHP